MSGVEIITYGGGDLLWQVFNAISMLFYGNSKNGSFIQPLCIITAMIGGALSISRCFFQSYTDAFLTKYFLPLLAIPSIFLIPHTRVHIIDRLNHADKLNGKPLVVDHVPFLFAKIASMTSFWGYKVTEVIENVMHTPNDLMYSKTGMIFGSEASLDFSRLRLNNGTVAQNIHHFTQQCIIYDIALRRYTLDELRKSNDLMGFLKENTSSVRMIPYVDPISNEMNYRSCVEAIELMIPLFKKEANYYAKHEVLKRIPLAYQALLSFKNRSEANISEQTTNALINTENICEDIIAVNAFNDAASRFAIDRARDNQRNVYQTAGALAGNSLVTMRIVFEALIYGCFSLIIPLSLIPGGIKFIGSWIFLTVWIQLWPPLYAIINYITILCANKYAASVMGGISNGFSIFTSAGFQDIALDTAAIGGFLSLSVPLLSFYLLQNLQSMVHLTGSIMTPAHSSSLTAASELSTGNYSFSNASVGQFSYDNQTSFQHNSSPSLSHGFFSDNYGTHQVKYGTDHLTVNQDPSHLNTSISIGEAYTSSLQNAMQNAQTRVDSTQQLYSETKGVAERTTADFIQHIANSDAYTQGYSTNDTATTQESANFIKNSAESWGHQHGLSSRDSLEYLSALGLDWSFGVAVKGVYNGNCSALSDEARQEAKNILESKDFQEHYQRVLNCSSNESSNFMTDEGKRFSENYMSSIEKLKSTQEQFSAAHSELNQISENLSYAKSHTSAINTNLNTEFANWLSDRNSLGTIFDKNQEQELKSLREEFVKEKCQSNLGQLKNYKSQELPVGNLKNIENEWENLKANVKQRAVDQNLDYDQTLNGRQNLFVQNESQIAKTSTKISSQQQSLDHAKHNLKSGFEEEKNKSNITRLNGRLMTNLSGIAKNIIDSKDQTNWSWFDDYAKPQE